MAKDPAFLFYPGDYLRDTQCLSEKTQVSYDRIMCEHMRNICISKKQLNFFTKKLNDDELEELMMILTEVDGGFQIIWVAESIAKRKAYSESRRKNRIKNNKNNKNNICLSYDKHMENENEIVIVNKDIDINKKKEFEELEKEFENFWNEYDKKVGDKNRVLKKWCKLKKEEKVKIMEYLPIYKISKPDKMFRLNPETFLNQKGWTHEIIYQQNKKNGNESIGETISNRSWNKAI